MCKSKKWKKVKKWTREPSLCPGILNAKIYNLDTKYYEVQKWNELENVRYFYKFFKNRKNEFE